MRQVFSGWGVALKRKTVDQLFTIYFPHPLLHDEEHLIMWRDYYLCNYSMKNIMEVFLLCKKLVGTRKHSPSLRF